MALDVEPQTAKHEDRWRDADTETESSIDFTDASL
jgi:hypothetical protein